MEDNPYSTLSKGDKLPLLEQYRHAWDNLSTATYKKQTIRIYDGPAWEFTGGVLAQSLGTKTIEFRQLSSSLRQIPENMWTIELPFHLVDFSMDPGQDFLVLVQAGRRKQCVNI